MIFEDVLGVAEEFDAALVHHLDTYECEWAATLASPERLVRFATFVNAPGTPDPTVVFTRERGQIRPAGRAVAADGRLDAPAPAPGDGPAVPVRIAPRRPDLAEVSA